MDELTPDEARYTAALAKAELRRVEVDASRHSLGHASREVMERAAAMWRGVIEKLERQANV